MGKFTKEDILKELDHIPDFRFFPDLEHAYFHTSGSRINLYADNERWAIIFEKSGFENISCKAELQLYYYGNCLENLTRTGPTLNYVTNCKRFTLTPTKEFERIEEDFYLVSKNASFLVVRNQKLKIEHDTGKYNAKEIEIDDDENPEKLIDFPSLLRYLEDENPELFRATGEELSAGIPKDLPLLMKIDTWHHKSYSGSGGEKPSAYETYQLIAEILVTKETNKWLPSLELNNDWRKWPGAGRGI